MRTRAAVLAALCCLASAHGQSNGIMFGPVKEYDERTLLERFSRLQTAFLQLGNFLDKDAIKSAIGSIQGASTSSSLAQLGLDLQFPVTSLTNTGTTSLDKTQTDSDDGKDKTSEKTTVDKSVDSTSKTLKQSEPKAPELKAPTVDTGLRFPTIAPGVAAADRLAEQTQLSYQLVNLSMLLDRSVTERASFESGQDGNVFQTVPRTLVVGLDVSIVPKFKDAAAQVVIEAQLLGKDRRPILVTSMMPYEKTYNSATFTNKTSGFSLGTVFQFVGLSAGQQRQDTNLYFARDLDTMGLQISTPRSAGEDPTTAFGWQFRPSLNRKTVEAGTRQLFVVLSIPSGLADTDTADVRFTAKTRWYAFDRGRNLLKHPLGEEEETDLGTMTVRSAVTVADALRPKVFGSTVTLSDAGGGNLLVTAKGENFFPGTTVSIGQVVQAPSEEFAVPGQSTIRFLTSVRDFLTKSPEIVGPYGASKPLFETTPASPVVFQGLTTVVEPVDAETVRLTVKGQASFKDHPKFKVRLFGSPGMLRAEYVQKFAKGERTIQIPLTLVAGGYAYGLNDRPATAQSDDHGGFEVSVFAPLTSLRAQEDVKLVHLLHNSQQALTCPLNLATDLIVDGLTAAQSGESSVFTLRGGPFHAGLLKLLVGTELLKADGAWPSTDGATVVTFVGGFGLLEGLKSVTLLREGRAPLQVGLTAPAMKTAVTAVGPAKVGQSVPLVVEGTGLDKVTDVKIGDESVEWFLDAADKRYKLILKPARLEKPGTVTLTFIVEGGSPVRFGLKIEPASG